MSDYRRYRVEGGTYFFTLVTHGRRRLFRKNESVDLLRSVVAEVRSELPFAIDAAVVLPDHVHFLWTLPRGDCDYSKRIGKIKATFSSRLTAHCDDRPAASNRRRESNIWQRRFWEHTVQDEDEYEAFLAYIHYNPVKHGWTTCPHLWSHSSFGKWVRRGVYDEIWGCQCPGRTARVRDFRVIEDRVGE